MRLQDFEKEVIWAESMTGDSFQCVHVDYAREMRAELARLAAENERLLELLKHAESALGYRDR